MKNTSNFYCTREVDSTGRMLIPKEVRERFGIVNGKTTLEMYIEDDKAIIKVHAPGCFLCGEISNTVEFKGKRVCLDCIDKLVKIKELNVD